jgi:EAL domain-containing protein (putative c-di-GMP-specific phosphodiesterase class I)
VGWRHQHGELEGEAVSAVAVEGGLVGGTVATLFEHTRRALLATAHAHTDATGSPLWIGVPLTRDELVHPDTRKLVESTVAHPGIGGLRLRIDVTEDTVIDPTALDTLGAVRALGVMVTVDRFGTGPSSLLSLDDYPADAIRVDRSFVEGLGRRRDDTIVVTAVTSLAPLLGLEVGADGITEEFQSTYLEGLGVLTGRGRLFGERLGVDELGAAAGQVRWLDTSLEATR